MNSADVKIALENNFRINKSPLLKMAIDCIADLEKENAELKVKLGDVQMQKAGEKLDLVWKLKTTNEQKNEELKEESKTTVKELRDMLDRLISQGKGDYKANLIIFTSYELGHENSDSKITLNKVDDDEKTVLLQGEK